MSRFVFANEYDNFDKSTLNFGDILMIFSHRAQFMPSKLTFFQKGNNIVEKTTCFGDFQVPFQISAAFPKSDFANHSLEASLAAKKCGYSNEMCDLSPTIAVEVAKNDVDLKALCPNVDFENLCTCIFFLYEKGFLKAVEFLLVKGSLALFPQFLNPNTMPFLLKNSNWLQNYTFCFRRDNEKIYSIAKTPDHARQIYDGMFHYDFAQLREIENICNQKLGKRLHCCTFTVSENGLLQLTVVFQFDQQRIDKFMAKSKHCCDRFKHDEEEKEILKQISDTLEKNTYIQSIYQILDYNVDDDE